MTPERLTAPVQSRLSQPRSSLHPRQSRAQHPSPQLSRRPWPTAHPPPQPVRTCSPVRKSAPSATAVSSDPTRDSRRPTTDTAVRPTARAMSPPVTPARPARPAAPAQPARPARSQTAESKTPTGNGDTPARTGCAEHGLWHAAFRHHRARRGAAQHRNADRRRFGSWLRQQQQRQTPAAPARRRPAQRLSSTPWPAARSSGLAATADNRSVTGRTTDQIQRNAESGVVGSLVVTRIISEIPTWVFWALGALGVIALAGLALFLRERHRRRFAEAGRDGRRTDRHLQPQGL